MEEIHSGMTQLEKKVKALEEKAKKLPPDKINNELQQKDRLTTLVSVHHQQFGENPKSFNHRSSMMLDTKQEADLFRVVLKPGEKVHLDKGCRLEPGTVGYIGIENREGQGLTANPSVEEKEDIEKRSIRVTCGNSTQGWIVRPGKMFFAEAEHSDNVFMEAMYKPVKVNLYLFPR